MPREPFAFGTGFPEAVFARPGVPGLLSARDARNHPLGRETKRPRERVRSMVVKLPGNEISGSVITGNYHYGNYPQNYRNNHRTP